MKVEESKQIAALNQFNQEIDGLKCNCEKVKDALRHMRDDEKRYDAALEALVRIHDQSLSALKGKYKAEVQSIA